MGKEWESSGTVSPVETRFQNTLCLICHICFSPTIVLPGVGAVHVAEGVAVDSVPGGGLALGKKSL